MCVCLSGPAGKDGRAWVREINADKTEGVKNFCGRAPKSRCRHRLHRFPNTEKDGK